MGWSPHPSTGPPSSVSSNTIEKQTSASLKPWFLCFPVMGAACGDAPVEGEGDSSGEEDLFFQDRNVWILMLI